MYNNQRKIGALLSYIIIFLNTIIGLLYTPFMLHKMGQNEYGLYSLIASVIGSLTILDFGFGNAVVRYTAKFQAKCKEDEQAGLYGLFVLMYSFIGVLAIGIGTILYCNIDILFGKTMCDSELSQAKVLMIIMIVNIAFTFPLSIFAGIITAYERFVFNRLLVIIRIVLNTGVMILILSLGYKAIGMTIVITIFNLSTLLVNAFYCFNKLKIKIRFEKIKFDLIKEIFVYSFWIFLSVIIDKIYWSSGQFILGAFVGTVAVSIFAISIQLQNMYVTFSSSLSSVFLPNIVHKIIAGADEKDMTTMFIRIGRLQNYIMLFLVLGFTIFGKAFILLWAGVEYEEAYYITLMFFIALLIPLIQNLGLVILQAKNEMKFRSILYFFIACVCLIIQIPLAKIMGGIGCAISISAALLIGQGLIMNIYYHRIQKLNMIEFWKQILRTSYILVIIGSLFYILCNYFITITDYIHLCLFSFIYFFIYWIIAVCVCMNNYERNLVVKPILRLINFHRM